MTRDWPPLRRPRPAGWDEHGDGAERYAGWVVADSTQESPGRRQRSGAEGANPPRNLSGTWTAWARRLWKVTAWPYADGESPSCRANLSGARNGYGQRGRAGPRLLPT